MRFSAEGRSRLTPKKNFKPVIVALMVVRETPCFADANF